MAVNLKSNSYTKTLKFTCPSSAHPRTSPPQKNNPQKHTHQIHTFCSRHTEARESNLWCHYHGIRAIAESPVVASRAYSSS